MDVEFIFVWRSEQRVWVGVNIVDFVVSGHPDYIKGKIGNGERIRLHGSRSLKI